MLQISQQLVKAPVKYCCMVQASSDHSLLLKGLFIHIAVCNQRLATAWRRSSARMVQAAWLRGLPPRPFFLGTAGWGPPSAVLEAKGSTHLASMLWADSPVKSPHLLAPAPSDQPKHTMTQLCFAAEVLLTASFTAEKASVRNSI